MANEGDQFREQQIQEHILNAGGAATGIGMQFQSRVAAWIATNILAEENAVAPWELPANVILNSIKCETEFSVDDIFVETSAGGHIYIQAKTNVALSGQQDSELASCINQFVSQFLSNRLNRQRDHQLDQERDRLAIATSMHSPSTIRVTLQCALNRIRVNGRLNQSEQSAINIVRGHITRAWQNLIQRAPEEEEIRQLLLLIRIHTLDVDNEGREEREAKTLLRQIILIDHGQTDQAWNTIINYCDRLIVNHGEANRSALHSFLAQSGINLQPTRSYRSDIVRLREYSQRTLTLLSDLSMLIVGTNQINIPRHCIEILKQEAERGSLLVTGDPGAGKSGALHEFVRQLIEEGQEVAFLAVDRIDTQSAGLFRSDLGIEHDLIDVLQNWPGNGPAYLVIDALDTARSVQSLQIIMDLITLILQPDNRWHVIVSIRKYDLRHNQRLQQLFRGQLLRPDFQDIEFSRWRHIKIPVFSPEEIAIIAARSPELSELIQTADKTLKDLLSVPFNLRLMGELLGEGVPVNELTPIRNRTELFDRYWERRVTRSDGQGDARETVLSKAVEIMVTERVLQVERRRIVDAASSAALNELMSSHILVGRSRSATSPPDEAILNFSHNVLFDYAVARLYLRGNSDIASLLSKDPELILFIRPCLEMHYLYLWITDPECFWDLSYRVMTGEGIPEVAKLVGPVVVGDSASSIDQLTRPVTDLSSPDVALQGVGENFIRHMVGSLLMPFAYRPLAGEDSGPWSELLERLSGLLSSHISYIVSPLLYAVCERPDLLMAEQANLVGMTTRRLLEFAWAQDPQDNRLVTNAIQCICRTYESNQDESRQLLRRCLTQERIVRYGYIEIPWLSRELPKIISADPAFVREIYSATFPYKETSQEETAIGSSRILPLRSNVRQDYSGALYQLEESFAQFLHQAPVEATLALISVMESYVRQNGPRPEEVSAESFDFDGRQAHIIIDFSSIWDQGRAFRVEEPLKMLDRFEQYLLELAQNQDSAELLQEILNVLVTHNQLAVFWRCLLSCGASQPTTFGRRIRSLSWTTPILLCMDTTRTAGKFLSSIYAFLSSEEKEATERAILSIPENFPADKQEAAARIRDRLLGCLPHEHLVTDAAKRHIQSLLSGGGAPPNEPTVKTSFSSRPFGEREWFEMQGVPVDSESNQRIRSLGKSASEFAQKFANSEPALDDIIQIINNLHQLGDALATAERDGVHQLQRDSSFATLTEACSCLVKCKTINQQSDVVSFARNILLEAANHPIPIATEDSEARFERDASWGKPAPRIDAASGLLFLLSNTGPDEEMLDKIRALLTDKEPVVRYHIAIHLSRLYATYNDVMWELIEQVSARECNRGVLRGLVYYTFDSLAASYSDRIVELAKMIFDRVEDSKSIVSVHMDCVSIFSRLFIWQNHLPSAEILKEIIGHLEESPSEIEYILLTLRDPLNIGPVLPPNERLNLVRHNAWELITQIIYNSCESFTKTMATHQTEETWTETDQEMAEHVVKIIDRATLEIYFASGAFDKKQHPEKYIQNNEANKRFFLEAHQSLNYLAGCGIPKAVHNLLQTLEFLAPANPKEIFLLVCNAVIEGVAGGYQYESLAIDLIVNLVERYLTEFREVFLQSEECRRSLLKMLDIFIQAGWPQARQLVYHLHEIYG